MARDYVKIGTQYARDVVGGKVAACHWVKQACARQLRDLERTDWGYVFDKKKAARPCSFFELMPHIKGEWKTPHLHMEPWQCFIFTTIFGWVQKTTGLRRFRKALVVIPAGNGKSTICAVAGLYLLALDDEPGAEVVAAAVAREQAGIVWGTAYEMVQRCPQFQKRFGVSAGKKAIVVERSASNFMPVSREARSLQGKSTHGVIIDELAQHRTREVFDVLNDRTRSRKQPLSLYISTESDNTVGAFVEQVDYGQHVLDGEHKDERYFAVIYTVDDPAKWMEPASWLIANPNLGVSVNPEDMEDRCQRAQKNASEQASFLTTRLNVRVGAANAYFNGLAWDQSCFDPDLKIEDYIGQPCVVCVDLASKIDIATAIKLFEVEGGLATMGNRFYLPEDRLQKGNPNYDLYRGWRELGYLTVTPGNIIDYEFIEKDLLQDREDFYIRKVGFDEWGATEFSTRMANEGLPMQVIPQNAKRLSEPMKMLQARVDSGTIKHDGNPILAWNMKNIKAKPDANENVFPRKERPENKIDGGVALIGAYSLIINEDEEADEGSIYEDRGLRTI